MLIAQSHWFYSYLQTLEVWQILEGQTYKWNTKQIMCIENLSTIKIIPILKDLVISDQI